MAHNAPSSSSSSDSDSEVDEAAREALLSSVLAPDTLAALRAHLDPLHVEDPSAPPPPCPPPSDVGAAIARARRAEARAKADAELAWECSATATVGELQLTACADAPATLQREGVVRVAAALPAALCDEARASAEALLDAAIAEDVAAGGGTEGAGTCSCHAGFGTVLAREHRWDMYMPTDGVFGCALDAMLRGPDAPLGGLFRELFAGAGAARFHEWACLVSDAGAPKQPTHPDNSFVAGQPAQLYTAFVALQDVEIDMGPTTFLPRTHNDGAKHALFNDEARKPAFLSGAEYRKGVLRKGEAAVMDSRVLHCGGANNARRRMLLYFTLQNPLCENFTAPTGSKHAELEMRLHDFGEH